MAAIRNYASDEMFRIEVTITDAQTGVVRQIYKRGPYSKIGPARGVASQKANYPWGYENEKAVKQGQPILWLIDVKVEKAELVWKEV
jgi:hypothetical protein